MTTDEADIPPDIVPGQVWSSCANIYVVIGIDLGGCVDGDGIAWVILMDSAGDTIDRSSFYVRSAMTPV